MFYSRNFLAVALSVLVAVIVSIDAAETDDNLDMIMIRNAEKIPQYVMKRAGQSARDLKEQVAVMKEVHAYDPYKVDYTQIDILRDMMTKVNIHAKAQYRIETANKILKKMSKKANQPGIDLTKAVAEMEELLPKKIGDNISDLEDLQAKIDKLEMLINTVYPHCGYLNAERAEGLIDSANKIPDETMEKAGQSGRDLRKTVLSMGELLAKNSFKVTKAQNDNLRTLIERVYIVARAQELIETYKQKISEKMVNDAGYYGGHLKEKVAEMKTLLAENPSEVTRRLIKNLENLIIRVDPDCGDNLEELVDKVKSGDGSSSSKNRNK